jgi:hypothetical protein
MVEEFCPFNLRSVVCGVQVKACNHLLVLNTVCFSCLVRIGVGPIFCSTLGLLPIDKAAEATSRQYKMHKMSSRPVKVKFTL